jgi:hypothetical protein
MCRARGLCPMIGTDAQAHHARRLPALDRHRPRATAIRRGARLGNAGDHVRSGARLREPVCRRHRVDRAHRPGLQPEGPWFLGRRADLQGTVRRHRARRMALESRGHARGRCGIEWRRGRVARGGLVADGARGKSESPRLRSRQRQWARAELRRWHPVLHARRHLARGVDLATAVPRRAGRRRLFTRSRHFLRRSRVLAQAPGFQFRFLHRGLSQLGRRPSRRDLREQGRRVPAQCLGEIRVLGAQRQGLDGRRRDDDGQGHAR